MACSFALYLGAAMPLRYRRSQNAGFPQLGLQWLAQLRGFPLRQLELEAVEGHRDQGVVAAQSDDLDQTSLAEQSHGGVVERLGQAARLVQRLGDVIDHLRLGV